MRFKKEFIFESDFPLKSCHASTIAATSGGNAYAAWFGGSREGADDVQIWGATRENGCWSIPKQISHEEGVPHWNPVLFTKADGTMLLFYKIGREISRWSTLLSESRDRGKTWSAPRKLVAGDQGGRGPVRNKVIQLKSGRWLAPASIETDEWFAFADRSEDQGETWSKGTEIKIEAGFAPAGARVSEKDSAIPLTAQSYQGRGVIQPTLWESPAGPSMLLRSSEGRVYRSDSQDDGVTWTAAYATELPNNNSGIDVVLHSDNCLYLVYNPVGVSFGPRTPLVLAKSVDQKSFETILILEDGPGEYSYPAIVSVGESLWITYTWKRQTIAFWQIQP